MRKIYYIVPLLSLFFLSSCERFDPPKIKLEMVNKVDTLYHFYGIIIDGGGDNFFKSKGYIYGFNNEPTLLDGKSTSFEIISYQNKWHFDWAMPVKWHFVVPDTVYYVRAWVKTNAGIGYSNPVRIKSPSREDMFFSK